MRNLLLLIVLIISNHSLGQNSRRHQLQEMLKKESYDEIIKKFGTNTNSYSAYTIYAVAYAYFMKHDEKTCINLLEKSIKKDNNEPESYYLLGRAFYFLDEYEYAIGALNKATELNPEKAKYYEALGELYYSKYDLKNAFKNYKYAVQSEGTEEKSYMMVPFILVEQKRKKDALDWFYFATKKINKNSIAYQIALQNIGMLEYKYENYEKAITALTELLEITPQNYKAMEQLIQVYNAQKNSSKADQWRRKLELAQRQNKIENHQLKEKVCIDQFHWDGVNVKTFKEHNKTAYHFYCFNQTDKIDFVVSVETKGQLNDQLSILIKEKGNTRFKKKVSQTIAYETLKSQVRSIISGHISKRNEKVYLQMKKKKG